jgi:hypothetical protein
MVSCRQSQTSGGSIQMVNWSRKGGKARESQLRAPSPDFFFKRQRRSSITERPKGVLVGGSKLMMARRRMVLA